MVLYCFDATLLLFSSISAGPAGIEPTIAAAGLANTILGLIAVQLFIGLPQAFIVLALVEHTGNENGGALHWADKLIGRRARNVCAFAQLVANCATAAAVAQIADAYLSTAWSQTRLVVYAISVGSVIISFSLCAISIRAVVRACSLFALFTLFVFSILFAYSVPKIEWRRLKEPHVTSVDWVLFLNYLIFNATGYDASAVLSSEMAPNARAMLKWIILSVMIITAAMYTITLGTAYLATREPDSEWHSGHFADVGGELGGAFLKILVIAAAIGSMCQMFTSSFEMATVSIQSGFNASRFTSLWVVFFLSIGFCFVPIDASLGIQACFYSFLYIVEIFLYTLLNRRVNILLYTLFALSLVISIVVIIAQHWYVSVASFGTLGALALISTATNS
jgi:hypothetical protein